MLDKDDSEDNMLDKDDTKIGEDYDESIGIKNKRSDFSINVKKQIDGNYHEWCKKTNRLANECFICNKIAWPKTVGSRWFEFCHIDSALNGVATVENGVRACNKCNKEQGKTNMIQHISRTYGKDIYDKFIENLKDQGKTVSSSPNPIV